MRASWSLLSTSSFFEDTTTRMASSHHLFVVIHEDQREVFERFWYDSIVGCLLAKKSAQLTGPDDDYVSSSISPLPPPPPPPPPSICIMTGNLAGVPTYITVKCLGNLTISVSEQVATVWELDESSVLKFSPPNLIWVLPVYSTRSSSSPADTILYWVLDIAHYAYEDDAVVQEVFRAHLPPPPPTSLGIRSSRTSRKYECPGCCRIRVGDECGASEACENCKRISKKRATNHG